MPQMSGTELLLQLRAEGVDADVIMVTSANDAKTVNDAVRLGAVDYLVKPFDSAQITACLRKLNLLPETVRRYAGTSREIRFAPSFPCGWSIITCRMCRLIRRQRRWA